MNVWEKYYDMTYHTKKCNMHQKELMDYEQTISSFFSPSTMGLEERSRRISEMERRILFLEEEKKKRERVQSIQVRPPAESARYVRIRQAAESSQSIRQLYWHIRCVK